MSGEINIRKGCLQDWDGLSDVFHRPVREGAGYYTQAQCRAWSPASRAGPDWSVRMSKQSVQLAETASGELVGFMTAELNGYLDCAYILSKARGQGVFRRLYEPLEAEQRAHSMARMHTHASLHARPAFAAMGYRVIRPETVKMAGDVWLPRFAMEKLF